MRRRLHGRGAPPVERGHDVAIIDTAGRLHTKTNLMEELRKVRRVADRDPGDVAEVLLVLDASSDAAFFHAVDAATGQVVWRVDAGAPLWPSPVVAGETAWFMTSLGELWGVDPRTGEERWHFHGQQILVDNDAAVASGSEVVVVLQRGALFGIDPRHDVAVTDDGGHAEIESEKWRTEVANPWIETLASNRVAYASLVASHALAVVTAAMRNVPRVGSSPPRSNSLASSARPRMRRAYDANAVPAAVSRMPRPSGSTRSTLSAVSRTMRRSIGVRRSRRRRTVGKSAIRNPLPGNASPGPAPAPVWWPRPR